MLVTEAASWSRAALKCSDITWGNDVAVAVENIIEDVAGLVIRVP